MRRSVDQYDDDGRLSAGYDYINQAWVQHGQYVSCAHPATMQCLCFGRLHAGEVPPLGRRDVGAGQMDRFLLKEWLLLGQGLLDRRQIRRLIKWTEAYVHHA